MNNNNNNRNNNNDTNNIIIINIYFRRFLWRPKLSHKRFTIRVTYLDN